jgi:hypothetical protein
MSSEGTIALKKHLFKEKEEVFCKFGNLQVSTFMYESGVRAVKISNNKGHIVILPYKGQQIWDAVFDRRNLAMKSFFPQPRNVTSFLDTYGCFMMHCGALRMGCPGPEDDHPLHGELPYADYDKASLVFGEENNGKYIGVTGVFEYKKAFGDAFHAKPLVKLYEGSSIMDVSITIENMSKYPMDLMYMCHFNFAIAENGMIFQTADWDSNSMLLRTSIPEHVKVSKSFLEFLDKLKVDPRLTQVIKPEDEYYPEIVFFINKMKKDKDGWAHFMQIHEDGSADIVSQRPEELDHHARWILKSKNREVMGILPASCDPEGYTAEKKKGNVRQLPAGDSVTWTVKAGYLDKTEAQEIKKHIESL